METQTVKGKHYVRTRRGKIEGPGHHPEVRLPRTCGLERGPGRPPRRNPIKAETQIRKGFGKQREREFQEEGTVGTMPQ